MKKNDNPFYDESLDLQNSHVLDVAAPWREEGFFFK